MLFGQASNLFIIVRLGIVIFVVYDAGVMSRGILTAVVSGVESKFVNVSWVTSKNNGIERIAEIVFD